MIQRRKRRTKLRKWRTPLILGLALLLVSLSTAVTPTCVSGRYSTYTLKILSVQATDGGITSPSGSVEINHGESITVSEKTFEGYKFIGWYLDKKYMGNLSTITLTMTQDHVLQAVFIEEAAYDPDAIPILPDEDGASSNLDFIEQILVIGEILVLAALITLGIVFVIVLRRQRNQSAQN